MTQGFWTLALVAVVACAQAQTVEPQPRIVSHEGVTGQVTEVEVAPHFVTAITLPDSITSVAVGDPTLFQVEHSEKEPKLLFLKALTASPTKTNVLISTTKGQQVSLLVVSKGGEGPLPIDFLVNYLRGRSFLIEPSAPSAMVPETVPVTTPQSIASKIEDGIVEPSTPIAVKLVSRDLPSDPPDPPPLARRNNLDKLLARQEGAPLPTLYGEHPQAENAQGERVRAGVGQVIDGGEQVVTLFSVVNPQRQDILLMPPQIQLGGKTHQGKLIKHSKWTTAEQLAVVDYRLSKRRLGPGERADGVVVFERPPYKQSNETLFLQMAEAGAVDHPALAPIGFGINTSEENEHARDKSGK